MKTAFPLGKGKGNQWAQALQSKGSSDRKKWDPDAMDVDSTTLGEDERWKLLKEGRCFHCKRLGHLPWECPNWRKSPRQWDYEDKAGGSKATQQEAPPKYEWAWEMSARVEEALVDEEPEKKALHIIQSLSKKQWAKLLANLMAIDNKDFWLALPKWPGYEQCA